MVVVRTSNQSVPIFSYPQSFLDKCTLFQQDGDTSPTLESEGSVLDEGSPNLSSEASRSHVTDKGQEEGFGCSTCNTSFPTLEDQRQHFKLDWHRANIKARMRGNPIMTEEEFEDHVAEMSSISGSDSETDLPTESQPMGQDWLAPTTSSDGAQTNNNGGSPKILFANAEREVFYVWRHVLQGSKEDNCDWLGRLRQIPQKSKWAIFMCSGGHFAGAVFDGTTVTHHKTIHRYVVRKKNGTIQSVRDGASGTSAPKSAGASIRRHNEAMLAESIYLLLTKEWKDPLSQCDLVFVGAPSVNARYFFGSGKKDEGAFQRANPKVRPIPFTTRRPTFAEVKRVHSILSGAHYLPPQPAKTPPSGGAPTLTASLLRQLEPSVAQRKVGGSASTSVIAMASDTTTDLDIDSVCSDDPTGGYQAAQIQLRTGGSMLENIAEHQRIGGGGGGLSPTPKGKEKDAAYVACENGDLNGLKEGLGMTVGEEGSDEEGGDEEDAPGDFSGDLNVLYEPNGWTLLHCASFNGHASLVTFLLNLGADPTVKDYRVRVPYLLAKEKDARDAFRRHMGRRPDQWDYAKACVPSPLTPEVEAEKAEKEAIAKAKAEKLKAKRKKEQEKKREKKKVEKEREAAEQQIKAQEEAQARAQQATAATKQKVMTEREKRALAAEKRQQELANQKKERARQVSLQGRQPPPGGCFNCGMDLKGVTPFERLTFKYCSMECLAVHREYLESQSGHK